MRIIKPPQQYRLAENEKTIFLAGSIEMGKAEDWQSVVQEELKNIDCTILNPRRDDWDSSWEQKIDNPKFLEQVTWELASLDAADVILMHLVPDTMSPISLLELGLYANSGKLIVSCPEGFWRKGNVDIVCATYGVLCYNSINEAILELKRRLK